MKKMLSILLALTLCLYSMTAFAESEIPAIEMPASFEGAVLPLGETGLVFSLPNDWLVLETVEGALAVYANPEGTIVLTISLIEQDLNTIAAECATALEQGLAKDAGNMMVNNVIYVLYTPAEGLMDVAYLGYTDGMTLAFAFNCSDETVYAESTLPLEILGTVAMAQ